MPSGLYSLWQSAAPPAGAPLLPEWSLPGGGMHLVLRLSDVPVLLAEGPDQPLRAFSPLVVAGARSRAWLRQPAAVDVVGIELAPGACGALLGVGADELAERHTPLADVVPWAEELRERLAETPLALRLACADRLLSARLRPDRLDPQMAALAAQLERGAPVRRLVEESGLSHRTVLTRFRRELGLGPLRFASVRRCRRAARLVAAGLPLAEVALRAGFADQPHLSRQFHAYAQMTLGHFRRNHRPGAETHVRAAPLQDRSRPQGGRAARVAP